MSSAGTLLAAGFLVNLRIHGEALGYIPASAVVVTEHGEAQTDETGKAVLSDDTETAITGIFDEAFVNVSMNGGEVGTVEIAAIVKASDVAGVERNAVIVRGGVQYYVKEAQDAQVDGSQVLLLSKHIH